MVQERKLWILGLVEFAFALLLSAACALATWQYSKSENWREETVLYFAGAAAVFLLGLLLLKRNISHSVDTMAEQLRLGDYDALLTLYKQSPLAYLTIKENGTIIDCNGSATHLLNGTLDTVPGNNFFP